MSIGKVASVAANAAAQSVEGGGKAKFSETFKQVKQPAKVNEQQAAAVQNSNASSAQAKAQGSKAVTGASAASSNAKTAKAAQVVDQVTEAQNRLDRILALAQSGKSFTPAELLALQAQVCSASQQLDLAGKVVEKATGGIKQVLQTQL
jgi:alanyl-tRNA synthetase